MAGTQQNAQVLRRCVLCPGGCELALSPSGPDAHRMEYPRTVGTGLCPRGSALGELLGHPRRILAPARRDGDRLRPTDLQSALRAILNSAADNNITILLDGNVSWQQMAGAVACLGAWPQATLCLVVEPTDEQLLLGTEGAAAEYIGDQDLADCDGFLIIGDAFGANPRCSRGVLDRHKAQPRTPIVVINPGGGSAAKFATHRLHAAPGMELAALSALAAAAGVEDIPATTTPAGAMPSADEGGKALAACKHPAVLIAAEYGRTGQWRNIGYLAAKVAQALGGGVAPQTAGANALAAVRLAAQANCVSLAKALDDEKTLKVAIGCDILGLLGRNDLKIFAAAAALPNQTTAAARVVLPAALPGEYGGTYLYDGRRVMEVAPLLAPPAGVKTPGDLVGALAQAAGVAGPTGPAPPAPTQRLTASPPSAAPDRTPEATAPALVLARQAMHFGCGRLTAHATWQGSQDPPPLRVSTQDAREMALPNLAVVNVQVNGRSIRTRLHVAPEVTPGTMVLPEGLPQARGLMPAKLEPQHDAVVAEPRGVQVSQ